jgi:hypothetical protein
MAQGITFEVENSDLARGSIEGRELVCEQIKHFDRFEFGAGSCKFTQLIMQKLQRLEDRIRGEAVD